MPIQEKDDTRKPFLYTHPMIQYNEERIFEQKNKVFSCSFSVNIKHLHNEMKKQMWHFPRDGIRQRYKDMTEKDDFVVC